ncbi:MAG: molybdopterin-dependent oxidoreductase, partial [Treponema sp.]|nr:molybdopterin-dependent oxidoreductase [Treponema sp.]
MESLPFLEDIYPPNFLYALIVRSPVAKGKLVRIETPDLPENFTLITAKDIPAVNRLEDTQMPVLADTDLNYIGEPVAILLGHDKTKLDDIFSRCVVIAEESKAVFNCDDAPDSPALFREIISGNPDDALTYPGRIVTGSYSTGIQDQWYAEPAGAVTWYKDEENNPINKKPSDAPGKLVVKTATQWPNHVKRSVCCLLGIDQACVFVEPTSLNLHMDGKLWYPSLISCLASLG